MAIATGGALPDSSDAVVMHENALFRESFVEISCPVFPGDNIIREDEDAKTGEILFPEGWILRPQDIGVLAGFGICTVQVRAMPVIGILSTGPELVPADGRPAKGEVRETNSYLISALCRKLGAIPRRYGIAWEGTKDLSEMLCAGVMECDAMIISGGSAHDERDLTAEVISRHGSILLSGLSISPRKKMVIGEIEGKPIIGLPGHPASVYLLLLLVVSNLIQVMKGSVTHGLIKEKAIAGVDLKAHPDREYHIPVRIDKDKAFPLDRKAGLVSLLTHCDGIVHIPQGNRGIKKGEMLEVMDLTGVRSPFHLPLHEE
jgi:molybdopterin molybdotransferase